MKKLLLVLGVLAVSGLGFAGPKEDYEKAQKLAGENKSAEAIKVLQGVAATTDKEYGTKANFQLGAYYLQQNDIKNAKKHLMKVWENQTPVTEELKETARLLYLISLNEKNVKDAEEYIKWADNQTKGMNADVTSSLIIFYFDNNMKTKGDARYSTASKASDKAYVSDVSYNVGQYYLSKNDIANAKKYLTTSYGASTTANAKVSAGYLLSQIAMAEKKPAEAERYLLEMDKASGGKDSRVLGVLGEYYLGNGNEAKAEEYLKKSIAADSKNGPSRLLLLYLYEAKGNTSGVNQMHSELKKLAPKTANKEIGVYFANLGNAPLSEKYLKKSISEDKDNESKLFLGQIYAATNRKNEAITVLKEAVAAKVQGADKVLKEVQAMK